ncbi:MAG: hypothetical protein LCH58_08145 [Bacteroidetes bacterium]|uniref:hypothetical protein n=1 Tax=Phnomibacter sp. TaxID=2836217 RepID=UPI002FDDE2A9|nr:hypothetical protein [Bacteroidota bacterium]
MENSPATAYSIPMKYRMMENLHIVFWLFKDLAWCMIWKPLGIAMIFPTFIISVVIAWRTRTIMSELCHNLAVSIWIAANSYWMVSEFLGFAEDIWFAHYTYKQISVLPFVAGLLILGYYYLYYKPFKKGE